MPNSSAIKKYADIPVGEKVDFSIQVTEDLVNNFAELSLDKNPLHTDNSYAQTTPFGKKIGHGMLSGMWFSRLVGMYLPGTYALYLSQQINFHKPLFINTTVKVSGEIIQKIDSLQTLKIKTLVINETSGEILITGEALVKVLV